MNTPKIHITKSWRKSISMKFDRNGVLQIRAPKFMLQSQIQHFLDKNATWIGKNYAIFLKRKEQSGKYYLLGSELNTQNLILALSSKERERITAPSSPKREELGGGFEGETHLNKSLQSFFKKEAKKYILPRCEELAKQHGFTYKNISITSAKTRWGSCSSGKTLNFSYRLVMTPRQCIDYVIIHELCHLRQMNHSKKFWAEVAAIMPEYKQYEKHLKEFGWKYKV